VVRFIVAAGAIGYRFQQRKGHLREEVQVLEVEIDDLKRRRKNIQHHIPVNSLPEPDRFTRLRTERKHFIDTIKMIAYRAESSLASLLREHLSRLDDARALLRQIFQTEADLLPELATNTLTVSLHHLTQAAHDQAIEATPRPSQRNAVGLPGHQPHPCVQTRLSLNSPGAGGLKVVLI